MNGPRGWPAATDRFERDKPVLPFRQVQARLRDVVPVVAFPVDRKQLLFHDQIMTFEERMSRVEANLERLASVQDQMMDVLGFSMEGERRLATRTERLETTVLEIGEKRNALIGVVDGLVDRG